LHLSEPLPTQGSTILEGFWPFGNWKLNCAKSQLLSTTLIVDLEDLVIRPYYGPKNLKLAPTYTPFRNINNGNFVLVKFHNLVLVWLGRTHSDVVKDDQNEFFKMMRVQWWVP
jgi:hypothetical protein